MRMLMKDSVFFQMIVLASGVLLTEFARGLTPENDTLIGIRPATPLLSRSPRIPAIALVERLCNRRAVTVIFALNAIFAICGVGA